MTRKAVEQAIRDAEDRRSMQTQAVLNRLISLEKYLGLAFVDERVPAAPAHHEKLCSHCGHATSFKYGAQTMLNLRLGIVPSDYCACACHKPAKAKR